MGTENPLILNLPPEMVVQNLINSQGLRREDLILLLSSVKTINGIPDSQWENILRKIGGANTVSPQLRLPLYQSIATRLHPELTEEQETPERGKIIDLTTKGNVLENIREIFGVVEVFLHMPEQFPWPKTDYLIAVSALGCELLGHLSARNLEEPDQKYLNSVILYLTVIHELLVGARTNFGAFAMFQREIDPSVLDCTKIVCPVESESMLQKIQLDHLLRYGEASPIYKTPSEAIFPSNQP